MDGSTMNADNWSPYILSLVTFAPLTGALLLVLFPRRDRDIRIFALVLSLLTFVLSLHLAVYFHRTQSGFQYEVNQKWISSPNIHYHMGIDGISLWLVLLTTFLTPLCVLISWTSIHDRVKEFFIILLHFARPVPLLFLLGSHADPHGTTDRDVRPRAQSVRGGQILSLHHDRFRVHAGGHPLALCADRQL
jgi:NADH-ubiquinone oxidoreductase chain 4, amino terminus